MIDDGEIAYRLSLAVHPHTLIDGGEVVQHAVRLGDIFLQDTESIVEILPCDPAGRDCIRCVLQFDCMIAKLPPQLAGNTGRLRHGLQIFVIVSEHRWLAAVTFPVGGHEQNNHHNRRAKRPSSRLAGNIPFVWRRRNRAYVSGAELHLFIALHLIAMLEEAESPLFNPLDRFLHFGEYRCFLPFKNRILDEIVGSQ